MSKKFTSVYSSADYNLITTGLFVLAGVALSALAVVAYHAVTFLISAS